MLWRNYNISQVKDFNTPNPLISASTPHHPEVPLMTLSPGAVGSSATEYVVIVSGFQGCLATDNAVFCLLSGTGL